MHLEDTKEPDRGVVEDARRLAAAGADRETIIVFLRERGFGKIDSIKTIRVFYQLSMADAKKAVDYSAAWSDRFESDMQFRETAIQALHDLAASNEFKITFTKPDDLEK